jgi:integration host factor subunit beta
MPERTKTLTKKDVSRQVAEQMDEPIYQSEEWVSAVLDAMGDLLIEADPEVRIELRGFGVFEVKKTKAKPKARNPKTNETVFIPSRRKTHFKPSKRLKDVLQVPLRAHGYAIPEGSADKHLEDVPLDTVAADGTPPRADGHADGDPAPPDAGASTSETRPA